MSEEMKQEGLQEEEIQAETAETAQEEVAETAAEDAAEPAAEEKKEMSAEDEALNIKYMRLMADFQNFKRRTEKEKSDIYAFANEKIVSELLNVIDNFERALALGQEGDSFVEGMSLIFKQLQGVLEKAGVKEIEALGQEFDPNFHNAVMMEDTDEFESGKVSCVLQKGYTLNNKVIRPSMVKVAN
jgi:molecular chaperone GrpE